MSRAYYTSCPCKDCEHRKLTCHTTCSAFEEWKNNSTEIKEPFFPPKTPRKRTQKR